MKGLLIHASPRKKGNTELLLEQVMRGMTDGGCECEMISIADLNIQPCQSCGGCEKTGKCVIDDDMQRLYQKIDEADRLVLGSPIYFYSVTAQAKAIIDRCQAMWSRKYKLKQNAHPAGDARKAYLVSVAATAGDKVFAGAILTTRYAVDAMEFTYSGELLVKGVEQKGAVQALEMELARAHRFGVKIALP